MDQPNKRFRNHAYKSSTQRSPKKVLETNNQATLRVIKREELPFPFYREPKQIGLYSLDENRCYVADGSQITYYFPPKDSRRVDFDLNVAYNRAIRKDFDKNEGIDSILHWILDNKNMLLMKSESGHKDTLQTDFVCYRGLLTKIMCTPYENKDDWIICATKYKGTIYLCGFKTTQDYERHKNETERDRVMCSWGFKFEQYTMTECPGKPPDATQPINENTEYNVVVRTRLKNFSLIFGAEVDGLENATIKYPKETGKVDKYVELKTSRIITNDRQHRSFCRFKLIKWWCQSYMVGIPNIYCGFRDDDGIVRTVEKFETKSLPKLGQEYWSASVCMNFCNEFLTYVKDCVTEDNPNLVYKFAWKPGENISYEKITNMPRFKILKDWFIENL